MPVTDAEALRFVARYYGRRAAEVRVLGAGEWSRAYALVLDGREAVIRFGQHVGDFRKDQVMAAHRSAALPVPAVLEIGAAAEAIVLADEAGTAGAFTVLQTQGEPPGFGPPLHIHRNAAEAFYVLEGTYQMHLQDHQALCGPGSFVYVPSNIAHTFVVVSDQPGKKLNLFSPAAMTGFFEELAEAEANGTPTPNSSLRSAKGTTWESSAPCLTAIFEQPPNTLTCRGSVLRPGLKWATGPAGRLAG